MNDSRQIAEAALARNYHRAVLITLIAIDGSSYRKPGARMLITDGGLSIGAVSGGCLDTALREHADRIMTGSEPQIIDLDTTSDVDILFGHGLGCPGRLKFLFQPFTADEPLPIFDEILETLRLREPRTVRCEVGGALVYEETLRPPIRLLVVGAGNDAIPLIRFARELEWETILVDAREAFASPERFPEADRIVLARPESILDRVNIDSNTAAVLATHHYVLDLEAVRALSSSEAGYIGVIGSRTRLESILRELESEGASIPHERIYGPVGLDIGSETPAEIALAAIAEIKAVLERRDGANLRGKRAAAARVSG
jgi:xanthine/CO dehydrogenase XdhC/CoxF family maturation factor